MPKASFGWFRDPQPKKDVRPKPIPINTTLAPPSSQGSFELSCAKKLKAALAQKGLLPYTPKMGDWKAVFADMLKYNSEQAIKPVLDWYCCHAGGSYVPKAHTAQAFAEKFLAIRDKMEWDPEALVLTDMAKEVLRPPFGALDPWPEHIERALPVIVQKSLDAYIPFYEKLIALKRATPEKIKVPGYNNRTIMDPDGSLLQHLFRCWFFRTPKEFVRYSWLEWLNSRPGLRKMAPRFMAWSTKSEEFLDMGRTYTREYCTFDSRWDQLAKRWEGWQ